MLFLLLERTPLDVNARNLYGRTALHHATILGLADHVYVLLGFNTDHTLADNNGLTPEDIARWNKQVMILTLLNMPQWITGFVRET